MFSKSLVKHIVPENKPHWWLIIGVRLYLQTAILVNQ